MCYVHITKCLNVASIEKKRCLVGGGGGKNFSFYFFENNFSIVLFMRGDACSLSYNIYTIIIFIIMSTL
jgi:hypothetical protein